jgi:hypothetical protein
MTTPAYLPNLMDDTLRERLLQSFDKSPASTEELRGIIRLLVANLRLDEEETKIMVWDAAGRDPTEFDRVREEAWSFEEVGEAAHRNRIFAGFVTQIGPSDGHDVDYLIDSALTAGIASEKIAAALMAFRQV